MSIQMDPPRSPVPAVAQVLAELGLDVETLVAAILHDTIEDTPLTHAEIVSAFAQKPVAAACARVSTGATTGGTASASPSRQ